MLSIRLKDLCNKYGIFIMSATQLNGDYQVSETPDQNLLRGAKAIADWTDFYKVFTIVSILDVGIILKSIIGAIVNEKNRVYIGTSTKNY